MKLTSVALRSVIVLQIGLVLCGCGSAPADVAPTEAPPAPTATAPPPTATPVPTSTTEAPTVIPVPEEDDGAWDYVALGHSMAGGAGVGIGKGWPHLYADYIEQDLGVEVTVNNRSAAGETTVSLLGKLQSDETVRALVSEAEVITIWIGFSDSRLMLYGTSYGFRSDCGPDSDADMDCMHAAQQPFEDRMDAIFTELLSLRSTDQALIRITDECNRFAGYWQDEGVFEQLKGPAFEDWSRVISDLATKHGVTVVPTYAACNGPDGDDPVPADYYASDGSHFSEAGQKMIADLHRAVGYEHDP